MSEQNKDFEVEDLAQSMIKSINKEFKRKVASTLEDEKSADVKRWISTRINFA